jgi:uncharacterized protein YjdB
MDINFNFNGFAMKRLFLYLVLGLVCLTGMTGCEDEATEETKNVVALTGITVNPTSISIPLNASQQITATPVPADATGVWFEWSSNNPDVAPVSSDGTVVIRKYTTEPVTVTVKSGDIEVKIPVSVAEVPLEDLIVQAADTINLPVFDSARQLQVTLVPENATNQQYVWTSADPTVASVDATGRVTSHKNGTTTLTVSSGSISKNIVVKAGIDDFVVEEAIEALIINGRDTKQLIATSVPRTTIVIPYIWESDDTSVATVSETGVLTAIEEGTANVTVSYGSITKTIAVTVKQTTWPFKGPHILSAATPLELPACDFDTGGEGFAFHDDAERSGNSYRQDNGDDNSYGVDIEGTDNGIGNIGWPNAGEWLIYTLQVQDAGTYAVDVSASPNGASAQFSLYMDNVLFATGTAQNRGAYQNFYWVSTDNSSFTIRLSEGKHKFKFLYINGFNLQAFKFTRIGD